MALDIGIKLNLEGYAGVMNDLQRLDAYVKSHSKEQVKLNLESARREVMALRGEIDKLQSSLASNKGIVSNSKSMAKSLMSDYRSGKISLDEYRKKFHELASASRSASKSIKADSNSLKKVQGDYKQAAMAVNEWSAALRKANTMVTPKQVFNSISSGVAHVGSAFQSFGNALTKVTAPFRRFTTGILYGVGYKALNMVLSGFGGAFERYDTMNNYAKSLAALGMDADKTFKVFSNQEKAMTAIENLNEAVLGLPTGLDEIVASQKVFAGATGELEKSTKAAIATNNAFLASGMGAREQRFMQRYMVSLASGAELTATQWQSMGRIAPLVMRAVAEELDYSGKKYKQFTEDVQKGKIAGEDFLDAFIKVGTEGKVQAAANVMKSTWSGLSANLQNATKRMGENLLKTIDEVMIGYNGRNLVQNLLGFDAEGNEVGGGLKHFINGISEATQEWVRAHPKEITEFIDTLKSVDWASLLRGMGEGMLAYARIIEKIAGAVSGKDLSGFGKFMVMGNMVGRLLTALGGFMKGTRHLWAILGTGAFIALTRRSGGGLLGRLFSFLGVSGSTVANLPAPTALNTLRNTFKSLQGLLTVMGGIAITAGTGFVAVRSLKTIISDLGEIGDLVAIVDWNNAAKAMLGFGTFLGAFAGLGYIIGDASATLGSTVGLGVLKGEAILGAITTLASGIAALDMRLIKDAFKSFADITELLNVSAENLTSLKAFKRNTVVSRVSAIAEAMSAVYGALKVKDSEGRSLMAATKGELNSMKTIVGGMEDILKDMSSVNDTMKELKCADLMSKKDAAAVGKKIGGLLEGLGEAFSSYINSSLGYSTGYDSAGRTADMTASINNFNEALKAIAGKKGLIANMRNLVDAISHTPGMESAESAVNKVKAFLRGGDGKGGLFSVFKELTGSAANIGDTEKLQYKMENVSEAMKSIKKAFKSMKGIEKSGATSMGKDGTGNFRAIQMIQGLINQLHGVLGSSTFTELKSNMSDFTTALNDMLTSINDLSGVNEIDVSIELKGGKVQKYDTVVKKINSAVEAIKKAEDKIPKSIYRSIPVTITASVDTSGAVRKINSAGDLVRRVTEGAVAKSYSQNGGTVYRAGGGSIFKPRGTDIVPAMLTPGEFVHNKKAVDYFGTDFMNRINSLDIKGAMHALMMRGGSVTTNMNRQSIVNNTINNNQRVTQNINTNNPSMSKMRLSRFAGAF